MIDTETAKTFEYKLNDHHLEKIHKSGFVTLYENDLKYKKYTKIDISQISSPQTQARVDRDTVEYRFEDCQKNSNSATLDLSHLDLKTVPLIPSSVQYLFMAENMLQVIPDMDFLKDLVVLDLCNNQLTCLPSRLPTLLEELMIKNNCLTNIDILGKHRYLKRLDCSNNKIEAIPKLESLEILVCDNNNIKIVSDMPNLKRIACTNNRIAHLINLPKLEIVECDKNKLEYLKNMPSLRELYCSKNCITDIMGVDKLEILHCYKTKMTKIDYYKNLTELLCDHNDELSLAVDYKIAASDIYKNSLRLFYFA